MNEENIKLQEAMTKQIDKRGVWSVSGQHLEGVDIAEEYTVERTFVMKIEGRDYYAGVEMTKDANGRLCVGIFRKNFSTLDELKEKFPKLFELTGKFISYS